MSDNNPTQGASPLQMTSEALTALLMGVSGIAVTIAVACWHLRGRQRTPVEDCESLQIGLRTQTATAHSHDTAMEASFCLTSGQLKNDDTARSEEQTTEGHSS